MKNSHIEWTDHTFNPWIGCTKVDELCHHCYAEARDERFAGGIHWGKGAPRQRTSVENWKQPLRWNKTAICKCGGIELIGSDDCRHCGENFDPATRRRPRVFCASLADWLDDEVPIEWLRDLLVLIQATPNIDWLLLTKRPENWNARVHAAFVLGWDGDEWASQWLDGDPPDNVTIGTSVGNQKSAEKRVPESLEIPARVRFLSCEPLLGPVDLAGMKIVGTTNWSLLGADGIDWVICGGESGKAARPMHPDWPRSLRDQCAAAGVPFFFKQWGEWRGWDFDLDWKAGDFQSHCFDDGKGEHCEVAHRCGKLRAGRKLDGKEHKAFPI